jgi:predicted CopG family antitoxin
MATKTISLKLEAYERLVRARLHPGESFSAVVMRAEWPQRPTTAEEYLDRVRERGSVYEPVDLSDIEELKAADRPPDDKWPPG